MPSPKGFEDSSGPPGVAELASSLSLADAQGAAASTLSELDEAWALVADLTKALTGLTGGGSEFFTRKRGRYVADIRACVEYVERVRSGRHAVVTGAIRAKQEAQREAATLREALILAADTITAMIEVASEARDEWDAAPQGMRAGKILIALCGSMKGYRPEIDAIHANRARVLALIEQTPQASEASDQ